MKISALTAFVLCAAILPAFSAGAGEAGRNQEGKISGTMELSSLSDKYAPVIFNHGKHLSLAGNCSACHHQHGGNDIGSCRECHSVAMKQPVEAKFMPCRNCHTTADPSVPNVPSLKVAYHKKCFQCHRGMGTVGLDPKGCTELCHAETGDKTSGVGRSPLPDAESKK